MAYCLSRLRRADKILSILSKTFPVFYFYPAPCLTRPSIFDVRYSIFDFHLPFPKRTTLNVFSNSLKSSINDQLSIYSRSSFIQSLKDMSFRFGDVCHMHVSPGFMDSSSECIFRRFTLKRCPYHIYTEADADYRSENYYDNFNHRHHLVEFFYIRLNKKGRGIKKINSLTFSIFRYSSVSEDS